MHLDRYRCQVLTPLTAQLEPLSPALLQRGLMTNYTRCGGHTSVEYITDTCPRELVSICPSQMTSSRHGCKLQSDDARRATDGQGIRETSTSPGILPATHSDGLCYTQPDRRPPHERMDVEHLPVEILEHIFVLAGERGTLNTCSVTQESSSSAYPVELTVSAVSRRWRAIALNYSRLWTNIRLSPRTTLSCLQLYLDRSRRRPLNVEIVFTVPNSATVTGRPVPEWTLRTLMDVALQALPRWSQLYVSTPFPDLLMAIMSLLGQPHLSAPSLDVLVIECPFQAGLLSGNGNMYPKPFPRGAPRLRYVQLHRCTFPMQEDEQLPRLHSFDVASAPWTLSDLHVLSNVASQLVHLAVMSSYKLDAHETLHFPALRTLRIGDYFQNSTILQLVEAPQLEVLQIEDMEVQFNVTAGWYVDALKGRSASGRTGKFPRLRSLRLQMPGSPADPSPLIVGERFGEFLGLFPSIEHLAFVGLHVHHFVQGLVALHIHAAPGEVPLPKLKHLTLGGQSELSTLNGQHGARFFKLVIQLVKARRVARLPLSKVQVPAVTLVKDRFLPRKLFTMVRYRCHKAVRIEALSMPYPADIWLGSKWGSQMLPGTQDKYAPGSAFSG